MNMKSILIILVVALVASGCASTHFADPHGHVVDVHAKTWSTSGVPDARLIWVDPPPSDRLRNTVTNKSETMRAYIVDKAWMGESTREHIQIQYLDSGKVFEIEGLPLEHRPFSDLVWVENRYLIFDRWSQPHYGMHYVVDALEKKLILATPFPDQFYLDQQRKDSQSDGRRLTQ
jgi:hypothetical protein